MKITDIVSIETAERYCEVMLNDMEQGIATKGETMRLLVLYTKRIIDITQQANSSPDEVGCPKCLEFIKANAELAKLNLELIDNSRPDEVVELSKMDIPQRRDFEKKRVHKCEKCGNLFKGWTSDNIANTCLTCICDKCGHHNSFRYWGYCSHNTRPDEVCKCTHIKKEDT